MFEPFNYKNKFGFAKFEYPENSNTTCEIIIPAIFTWLDARESIGLFENKLYYINTETANYFPVYELSGPELEFIWDNSKCLYDYFELKIMVINNHILVNCDYSSSSIFTVYDNLSDPAPRTYLFHKNGKLLCQPDSEFKAYAKLHNGNHALSILNHKKNISCDLFPVVFEDDSMSFVNEEGDLISENRYFTDSEIFYESLKSSPYVIGLDDKFERIWFMSDEHNPLFMHQTSNQFTIIDLVNAKEIKIKGYDYVNTDIIYNRYIIVGIMLDKDGDPESLINIKMGILDIESDFECIIPCEYSIFCNINSSEIIDEEIKIIYGTKHNKTFGINLTQKHEFELSPKPFAVVKLINDSETDEIVFQVNDDPRRFSPYGLCDQETRIYSNLGQLSETVPAFSAI